MERAFAELKRGDLEAARDALATAWARRPHVVVALGLAEIEMRLGRFVDAAEHWQYLIMHLPRASDQRDRAHEQLELCRTHVGSLTLHVAPAGATVVVDDKPIGQAPLDRELYIEPGTHAIYALNAGRRSISRTFRISAGARLSFSLAIAAAPTDSTPEPGASPPAHARTAKPAATTEARTGSSRKPLLIGGGILAVSSAALGTYFAVKSAEARNEADLARAAAQAASDPTIPRNSVCFGSGRPQACQITRQKLDDADQWRNVAIGTFITAGIAATATAMTFVLWPEAPAKSRLTSAAGLFISPAVGGNMNGALLWGHF